MPSCFVHGDELVGAESCRTPPTPMAELEPSGCQLGACGLKAKVDMNRMYQMKGHPDQMLSGDPDERSYKI